MSDEEYYCKNRERPWRAGACAHVIAKCDSCDSGDKRLKLMKLHNMKYCVCCGGPIDLC